MSNSDILISGQAINFLNTLNSLEKMPLNSEYIPALISYLKNDIENVSFFAAKIYFEQLIPIIPACDLPFFLTTLMNTTTPKENADLIARILLRIDRPIFQISGLELIQNLEEDFYASIIIPLIYSNHKPLSQKAVETLIKLPGNAESILEQHLLDRSKLKRNLAIRVLEKINKDNLKLALIKLDSEDFLERIDAIAIIGKQEDRKYISRLEPFLNDSDLAVKRTAIEAISQLGGKKAKKILQVKYLEEDYQPIRQIITIALDQIKN